MRRFLDSLAFSSLWVAAAAATLAAAVGRALGGDLPLAVPGLAFAGTLVVYNVDRLRDQVRDRATSPERTRFVGANRRGLTILCAASALACLPLAGSLGVAAAVALGPALVLGLLHRRLKGLPWVKPLYVAAAWCLVVVGLPAVVAGTTAHLGWILGAVGLAVLANAIASNVRDGEAAAARLHPRLPLAAARVLAALGIAAGALAPAAVRPLVAVPLATFAALLPFRSSERWGLLVVDGALLAGALVALVLPRP